MDAEKWRKEKQNYAWARCNELRSNGAFELVFFGVLHDTRTVIGVVKLVKNENQLVVSFS